MTIQEGIKIFELINCNDFVEGYRWDKDEFLVWIPIEAIEDFLNRIMEIHKYDSYEENGLNCAWIGDSIVIYLSEIIDSGDIEEVFPKEEFSHREV